MSRSAASTPAVRNAEVNYALLPFGATPHVDTWTSAQCQEWIALATEASVRYRQLLPEQRDALLQGLLDRIRAGTLPEAEWREAGLQRQQSVILVEKGDVESARRLAVEVKAVLAARVDGALTGDIKADLLFDLAGITGSLAWFAWHTEQPGFIDLYDESLQLFRVSSALCPERWSILRSARLIKALHDAAIGRIKEARFEEAFSLLDEALQMGVDHGSHTVEVRAELFLCQAARAWQLTNMGRRDEAITAYDHAISIFETNPPEAPDRQERLANILHDRAFQLSAAGRFTVAVEDYRKTIALYSGLEQGRMDVRQHLAEAYGGLGDCEVKLERTDAAVGDYRQAMALLTTLEETEERQVGLGRLQLGLARGLQKLGRLVEAEEAYSQAVSVLEPLLPKNSDASAALRKSYRDHASVLRLLGRSDEADAVDREVPEVVLLGSNEFGALFESLGGATPSVEASRLSDLAATFLTYQPLPQKYFAWAHQHLGMAGEEFGLLRGRVGFRIAPLSFYKKGFLLVAEDLSRTGRAELFALCRLGEEVSALDWTNRPIYETNARWGITLERDEQIKEYCRFFFHFVYGRHGPFQIFESVQDLPWKEEATESDFAKVRVITAPLRVVPSTESESHRLQSRMLFKDAVFSTTISVIKGTEEPARRGLISLSDEELLSEGLPVHEHPLPYLRDRSRHIGSDVVGPAKR